MKLLQDRLSTTTVPHALKDFPTAKDVKKVNMGDTMQKVRATIGDLSNVLVVDNQGTNKSLIHTTASSRPAE